MKAFRTTTDGLGGPSGTICYPLRGYDYGLASDDTRVTGHEHRSYTLKAFGGYPSFTHRVDQMEEVEVPDLPPPDSEHVDNVCKPGHGADTCRYLTMGREGWSREKLSLAAMTIDEKVKSGEFPANDVLRRSRF